MDFISDFSKWATDFRSNAINKGKGLADSSKLSIQLASEQKKLDALTREVGALYLQLHRNDGESAFAELIAQLEQSEEIIRRLNGQIAQNMDITVCPECGKKHFSQVAFCKACGYRFPKPQTVHCAFCNGQIEPGQKFCTFCGKPVDEAPRTLAQPTIQEEPVKQENKDVCASCGACVDPDKKFCVVCGNPTAPGQTEASSETDIFEDMEAFLNSDKTAEKAETFEQEGLPIRERPEEELQEEIVAPGAPIRCPSCGRWGEPDKRFCTFCGKMMNGLD